MIENSLIEGYSLALYEVAVKHGDTGDIEKDLDGIKQLLSSSKEFRDILYHPAITKTDKKGIVDKVLVSQCSSKWVKNLLSVLIDKRRERMLDFLPDVYKGVAGKIRGIVPVIVQTAIPLTEDRLAKLKKNLEKLTKKKVLIETEVNKDIIGGMIVRIENNIIDGSVTNHLKNLKKSLLKTAFA
ncbi:F0F1-type ATP synthase, delta subunit [Candidatus Scalindua japonica]|uniref:ATP synthase subunit delta n=1 Tax=Candidatus Scalindua japonica TaxID=1284222 RepID=A0A286U1H4_9BACT|nr:ATP synthase F1 subunit delta [Candidatus Scalindua japonica]GAX61966.1 F0F1-type ATP synthase, delta subunit [Candidatus Scalindua japonica]